MNEKLEDIANYMINFAADFGMCDLRKENFLFNDYSIVNVFFKPVDSDDSTLNEFYVKIKAPFEKLGYDFEPIGDNVLHADTEGVRLTMTIEQLEEFVSSDVFRSITGLNKFKI